MDRRTHTLLEKAANDSWPVAKLEAEAQKHRREGRGGGRPSIPTVLKALHAWRRVAGDDRRFEVDPAVVEKLKPDEVAAARQAVAEMQRQLAVLAARLEAREGPTAVSPQTVADGQVESKIKARSKPA